MSTEHLGFYLCNLLIPGDPKNIKIATPVGSWEIDREHNFTDVKTAICQNGMVGNTYAVLSNVTIGPQGRSSSLDAAFEELLPICLGASYLTGLTVSPTCSVPHSAISIVQSGPYFPRPRAMSPASPSGLRGPGSPVTSDAATFKRVLEAFIHSFSAKQSVEKTRLLIHHWLDALACWSLEDLVLSTATMLEIIAATAGTISATTPSPAKNFNPRIKFAANRFGLSPLSTDFRNMRNDLVHEGALVASKFAGKNLADCAAATAEALNWIDQYIFAALGLGAVPQHRFVASDFSTLNAFSL